MQLPFSKKAPKDGSIDVKAQPVKVGFVIPPAIVSRAAPDLGDYGIEHPEQLPAWGKSIPVLFWAMLIGFAAWYGYSQQSNRAFTASVKSGITKLANSERELSAASSELGELEKKLVDLKVLERFVSSTELTASREIVSSALQSATDRVMIRSLDVKRRDISAARYGVVLVCSGTRQSFDAMRADLTARLSVLGWQVSETPPDVESERLVYEVNLSRKNS